VCSSQSHIVCIEPFSTTRGSHQSRRLSPNHGATPASPPSSSPPPRPRPWKSHRISTSSTFFDPMAAIPDPAATAFLVVFSYATAWGRRRREWEGDERVHSDDSPVGIHPHTSPAHALPQDAARTRHDVAAPPSPLCAFHATHIQVCCSCIALVQGTRHDATLPFARCHGVRHDVVSPLVPLLARDTMSPQHYRPLWCLGARATRCRRSLRLKFSGGNVAQ
jgi:hypothetical protein